MLERISKNLCTLFEGATSSPCALAAHTGVLPFVYSRVPEAEYRRAYETALVQDAAQIAALAEVTTAFAEAGIPCVPLKGCVLKPIYPGGSYMRTMCDLDLLIHEEDAARVKKMLTSLGYQTETYADYIHDEYRLPPFVNLEIHHFLVPEGERAGKYYATHDIWDRVIIEEDGTCRLPEEDQYLFVVAHFASHLLERGGSSLRGLLDMYVFRNHYPDMDGAYLATALEEMNLLEFEATYLRMAKDLFDNEEPKIEAWRRELSAMLSLGMLGTEAERANQRREKIGGGRLKYIWVRMFPSYRTMCMLYPRLAKRKLLLPFYYLHRMMRAPFRHRAALRAELSALKKSGAEKTKNTPTD